MLSSLYQRSLRHSHGQERREFMKLNEKQQKIAAIICAAAMLIIAGVWYLSDGLTHIEDTNGPDNFALQQITDENIAKLDVGALGVNTSRSLLSDTVTYSSEKFTGVYEVFLHNLITNRYEIVINHAHVDAGNFRMVLCVDDKIVHDFTLNELTQSFVIEDLSGTVSLRIAGESAAFMFDYHEY